MDSMIVLEAAAVELIRLKLIVTVPKLSLINITDC